MTLIKDIRDNINKLNFNTDKEEYEYYTFLIDFLSYGLVKMDDEPDENEYKKYKKWYKQKHIHIESYIKIAPDDKKKRILIMISELLNLKFDKIYNNYHN